MAVTARRLAPSQLPPRPPGPALLVVPAATPAAETVARQRGWSLVSGDGSGWIAFPDAAPVELPAEPAQPSGISPPPGRTPWGRFTLLRRLLEHGPVKQSDVAALAGVSQARVSQVLAPFARVADGWFATDWEAVCDAWLQMYRGPGGVTTHWYGLANVTEQAMAVTRLLGASADVVVSGDVAADLTMPWRRPVQAVVYARNGRGLDAAELSPATPDEATLRLVMPADPGVWPLQRWTGQRAQHGELALADPLQILVDLLQAPGADAADAAARWREGLRDGRIRTSAP